MTCGIEDAQGSTHNVAVEFTRLYAEDDRWQVKRLFDMRAFVRTWDDGTDDTIFVLRGGHAYAIRQASDGHTAWAVQGSLHQLVGLVMRLDPPCAERPLDSAPPRAEWR